MNRIADRCRPLIAALALVAVATLAASAPAAAPTRVGLVTKGIRGGSIKGITAGLDGNLWFTYNGDVNAIGRLTPAGQVMLVRAGDLPSDPTSITAGPDGNLWFSDQGVPAAIGRLTPDGQISEFTTGLRPGSLPGAIAPGPDGALWFVDGGYYGASASPAIGRITTDGQITEFSAGLQAGNRSSLEDITAGPDGNLWFTDSGGRPAIGRITPDGQITEFSAGLQSNGGSFPTGIAAGPDGNLWFTDDGATEAIGRITPSGQIGEFSVGLQPGNNSRVVSITPGPDGNMWFTDYGLLSYAVGRVTPAGKISEYAVGLEPYTNAPPSGITAGSDGALWFGGRGAIGRIGALQRPGARHDAASRLLDQAAQARQAQVHRHARAALADREGPRRRPTRGDDQLRPHRLRDRDGAYGRHAADRHADPRQAPDDAAALRADDRPWRQEAPPAVHARAPARIHPAHRRLASPRQRSAGLMFALRWKTLPGSYCALSSARRSYLAP